MFRFTIRDVLLAMVVVGVACAWWNMASRIAVLESDMEKYYLNMLLADQELKALKAATTQPPSATLNRP